MTARIRPAIPAEVAALHELAALTFPLACPPSTTEASKAAFIAEHLSAAAFDRYLADRAREVVVAEEAGRLVGYAMVVHGEPVDPDVAMAVGSRPTAELSKLYVRPEHHGGGVAAALVAAVVDAASRRRAASVWLGVNQHNARANRFYAKSGFETVGSKRFLVGEAYEDDWVRERRL